MIPVLNSVVIFILPFLVLIFFGIAIFLYGLKFLRQGLYSITSHSPFKYMNYISSPMRGFIVGFLLTLLWQSSSLTTVVTVGFISAGIIPFTSALGIVLGANLGTTLTERIFTLQIINWGPVILLVGLAINLFRKISGHVLVIEGLGLLLSGFYLITIALRMLNPEEWVGGFLLKVEEGPLYGVLGGASATFFLQSSSAFMAFIIALAKEGLISLECAIMLFLGADVGTCFTSLLAAFHGGKAAKLVACSHLFFNILSLLILYPFINFFVHIIKYTAVEIAVQVINAHFFYNLLGAFFFLPLIILFAPYLDNIIKENIICRRNHKKKNTTV